MNPSQYRLAVAKQFEIAKDVLDDPNNVLFSNTPVPPQFMKHVHALRTLASAIVNMIDNDAGEHLLSMKKKSHKSTITPSQEIAALGRRRGAAQAAAMAAQSQRRGPAQAAAMAAQSQRRGPPGGRPSYSSTGESHAQKVLKAKKKLDMFKKMGVEGAGLAKAQADFDRLRNQAGGKKNRCRGQTGGGKRCKNGCKRKYCHLHGH